MAVVCTPSYAAAEIAPTSRHAAFSGEVASPPARAVADWTVATADNQNLPFLIVDKVAAKLFLFDRHGTLQAATPVLVGLARGDVSPPGIGDRKLSLITPAERITPAGRFVADKGLNLAGRGIIWVDYDAAIAIHRVTDIKPGMTARDRLVRLASASARDRRISLGCINVSEAFYDKFIRPTFDASSGIVYILPETRSLDAVFAIPGAYSGTVAQTPTHRG
ncbi:hypothetical protein BH10PSE14_BH10PSE14_21480 [soil metagenome]